MDKEQELSKPKPKRKVAVKDLKAKKSVKGGLIPTPSGMTDPAALAPCPPPQINVAGFDPGPVSIEPNPSPAPRRGRR